MPCWDLGKYGQHWLPMYTDLPDGKMSMEYLDNLVTDGKDSGKTPWAACSWYELAAYQILNQHGNYPQETREETMERRKNG